MQTKNEKENITDKINDFVQRNRKVILITTCIVVFIFIGLIAYLVISDSLNKKAIAQVELLNEEFEKLRLDIGDDFYAADVNALLAKLENFTGNKKGFAGSKAWSIIAHIHSSRKDWRKAEESWVKAASTGDKTYLGPIALFNAAVAAEEQNKLQQAIDYFQQSISHRFEFPDAPRAQFNIGRLYEQLGDTSKALEAYRFVLINWQWDRSDSINQNILIWQNLARRQIIEIEAR